MKRFVWFTLLAVLFASTAFAAESKHEKDLRKCDAEGDAAVAKAKVTHPLEVVKIKRDAKNSCIKSRAIRAK
jgi:hypothetical protein